MQQHRTLSSLCGDAVEIPASAEEHLFVHESRRRVKRVIEGIFRQDFERRTVTNYECRALAARKVHPSLSGHRRSKNIRDTVKALKRVMRFAGLCIENGKNSIVRFKEVQDAVV